MSAPRNPAEYRAGLGIRPFSPAFEVLTRAQYGHDLQSKEQRRLWDEMSGGRELRPGVGWDETFINAGRGAGKDDYCKSALNFECRHGGHEIAGSPGQRLPALVVCPLLYQAQGTFKMAAGEANLPANRRYVSKVTNDSIEYKNGCSIVVRAADEVGLVGDTAIALVLNEWALIPNAAEIETNARPALRRVIGAPPKRIIKISSSYIKEGPAWETFRDHFGRDSDVLVVAGPTTFWNPNTDPKWLESERARLGDRLARMHFDCEWQDITSAGFFPGDAIGTAVKFGNATLPLIGGDAPIIAVDTAFSEKGDRLGVAVASHRAGSYNDSTERRSAALTTVHLALAWKPDRPPREMAERIRDEVCARFNTRHVLIDQHSAHAFAQLCRDVGLIPEIVSWVGGEKENSKADRYRSFRTAMVAGELHLPDVPELTSDLRACRSTLLPGGGERIEVPRSVRGHGDILSAVVMAASTAAKRGARYGGFGAGWWQEAKRFKNALANVFASTDSLVAGVSTSQRPSHLDDPDEARVREQMRGWRTADGRSCGDDDDVNSGSGWER